MEIKLSTNSKVVQGYQRQLAAYVASENATAAHYIVIDVGKLGNKYERLLKIKNDTSLSSKSKPQVVLIDATPKKSASKQ